MGKFFKKDLIFKNNKYHKKEYKSREEFWSNIKEKIINKGFEIDFSDNELFFMTTKWKQHDEKNQVKINILLKNNYKNQNKNLSITATIRVKNKQDQWILSENQYLQNFYLGTVK